MSFDLIGNLRLIDNMSRPLRSAMGAMAGFGAAAAGIGAAITVVGVAQDSFKKAMDFESQMSSIQALTGATDEQAKSMQDLALQQGALTKYSALEAAKGIEELLKAGLSTAQVQAEGLNAALNLATAGGLGLSESAELMATSLNSYKKDALGASQASNILAGTANASAVDLHDLRYSLSMVGAVADGVGQSFRDTNAALGVLGNNGLKGSDAGTSLKTFISNLVPRTDKAYNLFDDFGLLTVNTTDALKFFNEKGIKPAGTSIDAVTKATERYVAAQEGLKIGTSKSAKATKQFLMANNLIHSAFYDEKGEIKDVAQVAQILQNRFKKLTAEQRQYYLYQMFGSDAIRAANILYKEGASGIEDFYKEMSKVTALEVAKKKMDNAAGSIEMFRGAIETLQISALLPTMPIIKDLALAAAEFTTKYTPQITAAVQNAVDTAKNYISTHFVNNKDFQSIPDINGKIKFVFDDLAKTFNDWWSNGGQTAFSGVISDVETFIANALQASVPQLTSVAMQVGAGIAKGMWDGFLRGYQSSPLKGIMGADGKLIPGSETVHLPTMQELRDDYGLPGGPKTDTGSTDSKTGPPTYVPQPSVKGNRSPRALGAASGLDRVPYNGKLMRLHKDEAVLTKTEASNWRDQQRGSGSSGGVVITGNTFNVRNDADIEKIAKALALEFAK